jgi:hypothetical protein
VSSLEEFTAEVGVHLETVGERREGWMRPDAATAKAVPRIAREAKGIEERAAKKLCDWIDELEDHGDPATMFNDLRRRTEDLYDRTIAYVTVHALVDGARRRLNDLSEGKTDTQERKRLGVLGAMFELTDLDAEVFQAVNRSDAGRAVDAADDARKAAAQIHADLEGLSDPLSRELQTETAMLEIYYRGLLAGATEIVRQEHNVEVHRKRPDELHLDSRDCRTCEKEIRRCMDEIHKLAPGTDGAAPADLLNVAEACCSRLSSWVDVLRAITHAYEPDKHTPGISSVPTVAISTVHLVYCYSFAVRLDSPTGIECERELRNAALGHPFGEPLGALQENLRSLLGKPRGDKPEVEPLTRSELWAGSGDVVYNGASFALGALHEDAGAGPEHTEAPKRTYKLDARLKLSLLGNHCLCLSRTLTDPSPSELFRALRAGTDYALDRTYRCHPAAAGNADADPTARWRNMHGFASDVIRVAAETLSRSKEVEYKQGDVHVLGVAVIKNPTIENPSDRDAPGMAEKLGRAYGGTILRTNTHRVASALNEWIRYPVSDAGELTVSEFGYSDDWLAATDDATLFLVTGNPTWRTEAYVEAAQFAASCSAQLLLWGRQIFVTFQTQREPEQQQEPREQLKHLRELQLDAQKFTSAISAQALCWSRTHRRFVDHLLVTTGTQVLARDLEARLAAVELWLDKQDRDARESADTKRNLLLFILAVFGVFNLASALNLRSTFYEDVQWALFGLVVALALFILIRGERLQRLRARWLGRRPRRHDKEEPT